MKSIPLLQTSFYRTGTDWRTAGILGGIIVAVILGLIIYSRVSGGGASGRSGGRFSRRMFRREASAIGLNKVQIHLLEGLIRTYQVRRPFSLLSNTREFNVTLGKALRDIGEMQDSEGAIEERKLELYRIKHRIDRIFADTNRMGDTKQLRLGQNITFQQENGNRFTSVVTANLNEFYCAQVPRNSGGEQVKWRKGEKITVFIWGVDSEEMMFASKVLGYTTVKRMSSVMLGHTGRVKRAIQRRHRRRAITGSSVFYPVQVVEQGRGRKAVRRAVVLSNAGRTGEMIDISASGCSMSSIKPLPRGDLIKITFEPQPNNPVTVFGKIMDIRKINRGKTTLHVMFTRASSKNLNRINEYVYDFR